MMAIDLADSMRGTLPAAASTPRARAVSLDGSLEDADGADLAGAGDLGLGERAAVRDLDASLAEFDDGLGPPSQPLAPPAHAPKAGSTTAPRAPIAGALPTAPPRPAPSGDVRVQLVLEVAGPSAQVEALIAAVREKPIQVYPLTLCVKDTR
jgi:hypothetical protein